MTVAKSTLKAPHIKQYDTQEAIDDFFTRIVAHWAKKNPESFQAILDHVNEVKRSLYNEKAFTLGHTMLYKGCYPQAIVTMLDANWYHFCPENGYKIRLPQNWADNERYFGRFMNVLKCFAVNLDSQPSFHTLKDRAELEDDFDHEGADAEGINCP